MPRRPSRPRSGTALFPQVVAYVDAHLGDADLGPRAVAAAHFVSPRQLHKTFAAEGRTVAGWIRSRRLDAVRRDLADPALRERPSDLPLLVSHFLQRFARAGVVPTIAPTAWAALAQYPFPGNVRELEHAIEHAGRGRAAHGRPDEDDPPLDPVPPSPVSRSSSACRWVRSAVISSSRSPPTILSSLCSVSPMR